MASEQSREQASSTVTLFQRAHNRIITLQRVDEQIVQLLEQRAKIQEEMRSVQSQINDEFEKVMLKPAGEDPATMLSHIARVAPEQLHDLRRRLAGEDSNGNRAPADEMAGAK